MKQARFIYFDLGNVLLKFEVRRLLRRVAKLAKVAELDVWQAFFGNRMQTRYEIGEISETEYFTHICRQLGNTITTKELKPVACDIFWVNEPILLLLRLLAKKLFPRGILSNTGPHHWNYIQSEFANVLACLPSHRIISYEVHALKPFPDIYKIAFDEARLELPDLTPEQIVFIDDLDENIQGARQFGFHGILYTEHKRALEDLQACGIPIPD